MKVLVFNNTYFIARRAYTECLKQASECVPCGVYAIEKDGECRILMEHCMTQEEARERARRYNRMGWRAYIND